MPARNTLLDLQRSSHRITLYFLLNIKCLKPDRKPTKARNSLLDLQRSSHRITLYFSLNIKCVKPERKPTKA